MSADVKTKLAVAAGVGVAILSAAAAYRAYTRSQSTGKRSKELVKEWKPVGKLTALHIFPIKSCQGIQVDEADAEPMGLVSGELQDRSFMVVGANNNFLHARIHPTMMLIRVAVGGNQVELAAPNTDPVTFPIPSESQSEQQVRLVKVWGENVSAVDCGEDAARWLSQYIFQQDSGARLVHLPYSKKSPRQMKMTPAFPWMRKSDGAVFSDATPFHLLSTETANDLNSRLPEPDQISTLNFRPTITISGCKPYEEDDWRFVRIGEEAILRYVKPCDRCLLTTIDPATGIKHPEQEPLRTLRTYRLADDPVLRRQCGQSPLLGINLSLDQPGRIRVGDVVYAGQL